MRNCKSELHSEKSADKIFRVIRTEDNLISSFPQERVIQVVLVENQTL